MVKQTSKPRILGVIPAKGKSDGLTNKNMRLLNGFPMIQYILSSATSSHLIGATWVSTDDDKIEEYAKSFPAQVLRHDPRLSSDSSPTFGVIQNIVSHWENLSIFPDIVVVMRATSPLCTSADIDASIEMLLGSDADSVLAVTKSDVHPHRVLSISESGYLEHFDTRSPEKLHPIRRQELSSVYIRTGAVYATRSKVIKSGSLWGNTCLPYIMPKERAVNVNDRFDFMLAERLLDERAGQIG